MTEEYVRGQLHKLNKLLPAPTRGATKGKVVMTKRARDYRLHCDGETITTGDLQEMYDTIAQLYYAYLSH